MPIAFIFFAIDFYPRPPGGGRHVTSPTSVIVPFDFYPRPPGGGRPNKCLYIRRGKTISIHALRVEGDVTGRRQKAAHVLLISIHALRVEGDQEVIKALSLLLAISIHALRVEGDGCLPGQSRSSRDFYPRPPGGGRRVGYRPDYARGYFISIHALRVEGDVPPSPFCSIAKISIHALRVEGDGLVACAAHRTAISIHALRVEGDRAGHHLASEKAISIHALRVEGDPKVYHGGREKSTISIHALRVEGDVASLFMGGGVG